MAAVARLPQGALVLPGFDAGLPEAVWGRLGADDAGAADHPQHGFRRLADALGFDPAAVPAWHPEAPPAPARNALVSLALRPAPVTDQWRSEGGALAGSLGAAAAGLAWVEAPDPRGEALAIALVLREAAETGARARAGDAGPGAGAAGDGRARPLGADPGRQRRAAAGADAAGGAPAPAGGAAGGAADAGGAAGAVEASAGEQRGRRARRASPADGAAGDRAAARRGAVDRLGRPRRLGGGHGGAAPDWIAWLRGGAGAACAGGRLPLAEHVARHRAAAEALAAGPGGGAHRLWEKEAGLQARAMLDALAAEADAGGVLDAAEYRALVQSLMAARDVPEEAVVTHPGIAIWGTLEARVQSADRIVLGGLNEGIWPRLPGADPWLGRSIRRAVGLPSPERQIGLSAHDFQQAMGARRGGADAGDPRRRGADGGVALAAQAGEPAARPRGEGAAALAAAKARGAACLAQARRLDAPAASVPPAPRPAPRPPVAARPAELSVTQVETLVRDPYAIYARQCCGCGGSTRRAAGRCADPRQRDPCGAGRLRHRHGRRACPQDADAVFRAAVREALAEAAPWPAVNAIWRRGWGGRELVPRQRGGPAGAGLPGGARGARAGERSRGLPCLSQ